jgi:hypothetical protein
VSGHPHAGESDTPIEVPLPGERVIWQGAPDWRVLARRGFHWDLFALYFALLITWRVVSSLYDGATFGVALIGALWTLPLAGLALGFIALLAWLVQRTSQYTLTDRRVVLRVGIVLNATFSVPLRRIDTVRLRPLRGGAGDIALALNPGDRIAYPHLWPHARPWRFNPAEPMLRALPNAESLARTMAQAMRELQLAGGEGRAASERSGSHDGEGDRPAPGASHVPRTA